MFYEAETECVNLERLIIISKNFVSDTNVSSTLLHEIGHHVIDVQRDQNPITNCPWRGTNVSSAPNGDGAFFQTQLEKTEHFNPDYDFPNLPSDYLDINPITHVQKWQAYISYPTSNMMYSGNRQASATFNDKQVDRIIAQNSGWNFFQ